MIRCDIFVVICLFGKTIESLKTISSPIFTSCPIIVIFGSFSNGTSCSLVVVGVPSILDHFPISDLQLIIE
jgi:hypothetical protein